MAKTGDPVVLYAQTTINQGGTANLDTMLLQNIFRQPMTVTEMFILARMETSGSAAVDSQIDPLAYLRVALVSGKHSLTNSPFPLCAFGATERPDNVTSTGAYLTSPPALTTRITEEAYRRLKIRDFPMDVGQAISPTFTYVGLAGEAAITAGPTFQAMTVGFGIRGKLLDEMPNRFSVPYLANAIGTAPSTDSLSNRRGSLLQVRRMFLYSGLLSTNYARPASTVTADGLYGGYPGEYGTSRSPLVRFQVGPTQKDIIPRMTRYLAVAGPQWYADVNFDLGPNDRCIATYDPTGTIGVPVVGMLGYSEETSR